MKRSRRKDARRRTTKKHRQRRARTKAIAPHTAKQFFAMPKAFQDTWVRVTHVVSKMRADRVSLPEASREFGLDPRLVARLSKSALRKRRNGQYAAKRTDKLLRILAIPAPDEKGGKREIAVRDSHQATILGRYWAAVQKYLRTGDSSALDKFRGKRVTGASGKRVPLLTDLTELDRLGSAGVWSFESIYAQVG
ncbi:MAG: hypothetical protein WAN10_16690 [Candidatus Acidiferrales bacterium]